MGKKGIEETVEKVKNIEVLKIANGLGTFRGHARLKGYFESSYGFVVFEKIAKGGMGLGGAFGMGNVYVNNMDGTQTLVGYSDMVQISVGIQLGGQVFSQIIFFQNQMDYERFTRGSFEFGADAQVVALTASAKLSASTMGNQPPAYGIKPADQSTIGKEDLTYAKGLAVFSVPLTGLMYEATVAGQKFTYKPLETTLTNTTETK